MKLPFSNRIRKWKESRNFPSSFEQRVKNTRFNPTRNLTPERLAQQLDEFREGRFSVVAQTLDVIEDSDPICKTVAPKRKKSVSRKGWEILTIDNPSNDETAAEHKELLEYFFNHLTATSVIEEDQSGDLELLIQQMMNAIGVKYAVHEIKWEPQPNGMLSATLRYVPLWFFEHSGTRLRFLREYGQYDGEDMDPAEWMVTVGDNLMWVSAIFYMFKRMSFQDWQAFCGKFGIPGVFGKTNAPKGSKEWKAAAEAVAKFANEWAALGSEGDHIALIETKGGGNALPFEPMVEICDRYIAMVWRGADLSTISKDDGAGASLQQDEGDILLEDDIKMISGTLQKRLARQVIQWKYGPNVEPEAYIHIKVPQKDTTDQDIKVDQHLIDNGVPVSHEDMAERFQRPLPDKDETVVVRKELGEDPASAETEEALANEEFEARKFALVLGALAEELEGDFSTEIEKLLESSLDKDSLVGFRNKLPGVLTSIMADSSGKFLENYGKLISEAFVDGSMDSQIAKTSEAVESPRIDEKGIQAQ